MCDEIWNKVIQSCSYTTGRWRVYPSQKSGTSLLQSFHYKEKEILSRSNYFQSDCNTEYFHMIFMQQLSFYKECSLDCVMGRCLDGNCDCPCRRTWVDFNFKHYPFFVRKAKATVILC